MFDVWRYDKSMDHWKLINSMRKDFPHVLTPGKIAYDLIGELRIPFTDEEQEDPDRYDFYLTASLYHTLHSGGDHDFIHIVDNGISKYERHDAYPPEHNVYSKIIKLNRNMVWGEARNNTRIYMNN